MEDNKQSWFVEKFQHLCNFMEKETYGTEVCVYGASGLMLLAAYAKRKSNYLARQFKKPAHIPEGIINERNLRTGSIRGIEQCNEDTLLLINQRPRMIPLFMSNKSTFPVKLPGVKVNGNGFAWLQSCLVGRQATFIALNKNKSKDFVACELCLVHPPKGTRLLDISETLLKLRFAKFVQDSPASIKRNSKYYKHLKKVEDLTSVKNSWLNWAAKHPLIWKSFHDLKLKALPKEKLLPELVR